MHRNERNGGPSNSNTGGGVRRPIANADGWGPASCWLNKPGASRVEKPRKYPWLKLLSDIGWRSRPARKVYSRSINRLNVLAESSLVKRSLASIRSSDVAKYRDARLKIRSANTVRLELSALSSIFEEARLEWGMESLHNPVRDVLKPPPGPARERRFASPEEEKCLLDALKRYGSCYRSQDSGHAEARYTHLKAEKLAKKLG